MDQLPIVKTTVTRVSKMNILLVDDRPENLLTLESILEREDRCIIKASGGNEALRMAIKENIGLILLDIQMPDIDGVEVARLLRSNSRTRHIPIIFVSAVSKSERPCLEGFEEGTIDCLSKPLNLEETKSKVQLFEKIYRLQQQNADLEKKCQQINQHLEHFVYIVSHDLKAPLRAIDNLATWINDDLGGNSHPNVTENLVLMRSRVTRMTSLLEGLLEYSRSGRIVDEPAPLDLNQMVHGIFETLEPPSGFQLSVSGLPEVVGSQEKFYKIFYHLISNAVIHHHQPQQGMIQIDAMVASDKIIFSIEDNGPGIPPQFHQKVFDLFATLKSKDEVETTGVGLSVVKKIVNDFNHQVWIEAAANGGTIFRFSYPILNH